MKVNVIPKVRGQFLNGVGILPVYSKEMTDSEIRRLLNFRDVSVYDSTTGGRITKNTMLTKARLEKENATKNAIPVIEKPVETKVVEQPKPVVAEVAVPETVEEPVVESVVEQEPEQVNEIIDTVDGVDEVALVSVTEETNDDVVDIPETENEETDTTPVETAEDKPYYKKRNKKHRNNN